jgi:hypothetical protein
MADLTVIIAEILAMRPGSSAKEVAQNLHRSGFSGLRRTEVNSCLYRGLRHGYWVKRGEDPPRWFLQKSVDEIADTHPQDSTSEGPKGEAPPGSWRIKPN